MLWSVPRLYFSKPLSEHRHELADERQRQRQPLSPIVPPGAEPPAFEGRNFEGRTTEYTMAMISDTGRVVEKYRYVGRVLKFNGTEERHMGRRRVLVAKVRARWPQTVDFEKGEFVNKPEEEELVLWPSNYGARNKRDQVRAAAVPAVPVCARVANRAPALCCSGPVCSGSSTTARRRPRWTRSGRRAVSATQSTSRRRWMRRARLPRRCARPPRSAEVGGVGNPYGFELPNSKP